MEVNRIPEHRRLSLDYADLANEVIGAEPMLARIRESEATIIYLASDHPKRSKGRTVYAECEKVADKNKWAIPADFTITVYEPNCAGMDDERLSRLLFHELLHVGIEAGDDDEERYSVRPHDLEDFRECVERWGIDWIAP